MKSVRGAKRVAAMRCVTRHRDARHMNSVRGASRCEHAVCRASPYARQWNSLVNHQRYEKQLLDGDLKLATTGTITNFKTTPGTQFNGIGGDVYNIETAGKSYSITSPDAQTLRFEVHQGDNWAAGGDGSGVDRSEIQNDSTGVKTSWCRWHEDKSWHAACPGPGCTSSIRPATRSIPSNLPRCSACCWISSTRSSASGPKPLSRSPARG